MAEAGAVAERAAVAQDAATGSGSAAPYVAQFQKLYREHGAGLAVDAADAAERAAALEELAATGFPLRHDEEWAHTPVRAVVEAKYRLAPARDLAAGVPEGFLFELVADQPQGLVTVNGSRANGPWATITANGMHHAAAHRPAATFTRSTGNAFTRLARVFGSLYELRLDGAGGAAPVHLVHLTEAGVLSAPRVRVRIADGARVTLVETFAAANGAPREAAPSLTCGETEIHLGAGAALTYVRVQAAAEGAFDLGSTTVVQERDSELHALSMAAGARLARHKIRSKRKN